MSEIDIALFKTALSNFSKDLSTAGIPPDGLEISVNSPILSNPVVADGTEITSLTDTQFTCHWGPGIGFTCTFGSNKLPEK